MSRTQIDPSLLTTVNSNVGSFTNASITVSAKGLITAASTGTPVTTITGTTNQVVASASTGAVTLSTPQDIATASSPTFATVTHTASAIAVQHYSSVGTTASVGANSNTPLFVTASGQAYLVHAKGNSDSGYAAVWVVWDTAGGVNSARLGGHSSLSILQASANHASLQTTGGHAGQTYNFTITRWTND